MKQAKIAVARLQFLRDASGENIVFSDTTKFYYQPLGEIQESPFSNDVWAEINGFQEIQGVDFGSKLEFYRPYAPPNRGHGRGRGWINPSPRKASIG